MAAPGDVRCSEYRNTAHEIQNYAKVAPVKSIDEHTTHKRHEQSRRHRDNHLSAHLHGRMSRGEDVPADAGEIHPASKERNEHGEKEIAEAALRPNLGPVGTYRRRGGSGRGHGASPPFYLWVRCSCMSS